MPLPVLYRNHFQLGYVVRNLDGAIETMRKSFGVTHWEVRQLPASAPGRALGNAWVGDMLIELVDVRPERETIYHDWIPDSDEGLRLHHFGYLIDSEEEWRETIAGMEAAGIEPVLVGGAPGLMDWYYADTVKLLGHYTELMRFTSEAGKGFWANVPRN